MTRLIGSKIRALGLSTFLVFAICVSVWAKPHDGVEYSKVKVAGVPVHVVTVDMNRSDLVIRPVVEPSGHRKTFTRMIKEHRPIAAVNGTFFDTKTGITVGNLVSNGRLLSEGMAGSNMVFRRDGRVEIVSSARNLGRYKDWSDAEFAIGGGPTLMVDGEFFMNPKSEGFRDPSLFANRPRTAVGVTQDARFRMVVVTQGVSLWQLAHVMRDLGCVHALNLDGGSSTGLSVGQQTMVKPARKLTNLLGVFAAHDEPQQVRAVDVARKRALAHYRKGQRLMAAGKYRKGRSHLRQAVAKDPQQASFWRAAAEAETLMGNRSRAIADWKRSGEIYLAHGDLTSAMESGRQLLNLDVKSTFAHLLVGECLIEQGKDAEALLHLESVLAYSPGHPRAQELLSEVKFRLETLNALNESFDSIQGTILLASAF